jgi:hypothetical protein
LYISTPATGGGPVKPPTVGLARLFMLSILSRWYEALCGGKPGDARGWLKLPIAGEAIGLANVPVGESGS